MSIVVIIPATSKPHPHPDNCPYSGITSGKLKPMSTKSQHYHPQNHNITIHKIMSLASPISHINTTVHLSISSRLWRHPSPSIKDHTAIRWEVTIPSQLGFTCTSYPYIYLSPITFLRVSRDMLAGRVASAGEEENYYNERLRSGFLMTSNICYI